MQRALAPLREKYALITFSALPEVSVWQPYLDQIGALQSVINRQWIMQNRGGDPPVLAELTDETTKRLVHPTLREWRPAEGSLRWHQETYGEKHHNQMKGSLDLSPRPNHDSSDDVIASADSIVARDPEGFQVWLTTQGSFYYRAYANSMSWKQWCIYIGPIIFEYQCQPAPLPKMIKPQYHPPYLRPVVTLEKAVKGHHALKASLRRSRIRDVRASSVNVTSPRPRIGLPAQTQLPFYEQNVLRTIDPRTEPIVHRPFRHAVLD